MEVKLPKLGEGAESGTVVGILVQKGEHVEKGQTLLELENEKAVAPIPSTGSGVISEIRVKEGDQVSVGHVLVVLSSGEGGAEGASVESKKETVSEPAVSTKDSPKSEPVSSSGTVEGAAFPEPSDGPIAASPSVRKLARQLGIDLSRVRGTERGGRISMDDLKSFIQKLQNLVFESGKTPSTTVAQEEPPAPSIDFSKWGPVRKESLAPIRLTISRRMLENWNAIPHVTQFDSADITDVTALRKKHGEAYGKEGVKLTLTPLLLRAVAETLKKYPIFNASLDENTGEIIWKDYIHLGLAVDTDQGLLVPVIRDVDKKSVLELSRDVNEMAAKARERKVSLEEMQGGTFTISNQGGIGGAHFTPIINRPEVAILGLGRAAQQPAVRDGKVEPRLMMPLALSYDHRLIDGGSAARFMVDLLSALQDFQEQDVKLKN